MRRKVVHLFRCEGARACDDDGNKVYDEDEEVSETRKQSVCARVKTFCFEKYFIQKRRNCAWAKRTRE